MLEQIGFFHFGWDYASPIAALERELCKTEHCANALIVLPEAFNIGIPYRGEGEPNFDRVVLDDLRYLAARFRVSFVAGLVVREKHGPHPPWSSAYFVNENRNAVLTRKIGADDRAGIIYTPCARDQADVCNPIDRCGIRIGALICVDANPTRPLARVLLPRLRTVVENSDIVCIPAHMADGNFRDGKAGARINLTWPLPHKRVVLANSNPDGIDSFVTDADGVIVAPTFGGARNAAVTVPLRAA
jgi:predicted amidohydrolase